MPQSPSSALPVADLDEPRPHGHTDSVFCNDVDQRTNDENAFPALAVPPPLRELGPTRAGGHDFQPEDPHQLARGASPTLSEYHGTGKVSEGSQKVHKDVDSPMKSPLKRTCTCKANGRPSETNQGFPCSMNGCTKSYKRKGDLRRHVKTHRKESWLLCSEILCIRSLPGKGFPRKDKLANHLEQRHKYSRVEANFLAELAGCQGEAVDSSVIGLPSQYSQAANISRRQLGTSLDGTAAFSLSEYISNGDNGNTLALEPDLADTQYEQLLDPALLDSWL